MIRFFGLLVLIANFVMVAEAQAQTVISTPPDSTDVAEAKPASEEKAEKTAPAMPSEKDVTYLICKSRASVRTLRVQTRNNGSCFTTYTKEGVDQIVGSSKENQTCLKVLSNIRENLEKGSWKCKDISEARVSSSLE